MNYRRLETLVIVTGAVLALAGVLLMPEALQQSWPEVAAHLATVVVLAAAAHWGRDAGMIAAVVAVLGYAAVRVPALITSGLTPDVARSFVAYAAIYACVGIVGGEIFSRLRYLVTRVGESALLDEQTGVLNCSYCGQALASALSAHERYDRPLSLVVLTLNPSVLSTLAAPAQRKLLRTAAASLRNDMRVVDDVGHLGEGRFLLTLRETPRDGAQVVAERVRLHVCHELGVAETSVTTRVLAAPEDLEAMATLARSLQGPAAAPQPTA